jgi:hypothetical protein
MNPIVIPLLLSLTGFNCLAMAFLPAEHQAGWSEASYPTL